MPKERHVARANRPHLSQTETRSHRQCIDRARVRERDTSAGSYARFLCVRDGISHAFVIIMRPEPTDSEPGLVLWEQAPLSCRFLSHPTEPRFETRLYASGVLIAQTFFTDHVEASEYAVQQMRMYGG